MISSYWQKNLIELWRDKKLLTVKLIFPLIICIPLFLIKAPVVFLSIIISSLIIVLGVFNAGANIIRDKNEGILQRIIITPLSKEKIVLDAILSNSITELMQFLPILIILTIGVTFAFSLPIVVAFLLNIFFVNILGVLISTVFPSSSELRIMLFTVLIFPLLVFSGVIIPPESQLQINVAKIFPSSYFHQAVLLSVTKQSIFSSQEILLLPIFPTLFFLIITIILSESIIRTGSEFRG